MNLKIPAMALVLGSLSCKHTQGDKSAVKIVNGEEVSSADLYAMGIVRLNGVSKRFTCSGALVHPRIVLTAAHCIVGEFGVTIGYDTAGDNYSERHFRPGEFAAHPHTNYTNAFVNGQADNDIAVIVLGADAPAGTTTIDVADSGPREGEEVYAVGFGKTEREKNTHVARKGLLKVKRNDDAAFRTYSKEIKGIVAKGDSGGPLLRVRSNRVELLAVNVAVGSVVGDKFYDDAKTGDIYAVSNKVGPYLGWAKKIAEAYKVNWNVTSSDGPEAPAPEDPVKQPDDVANSDDVPELPASADLNCVGKDAVAKLSLNPFDLSLTSQSSTIVSIHGETVHTANTSVQRSASDPNIFDFKDGSKEFSLNLSDPNNIRLGSMLNSPGMGRLRLYDYLCKLK